MHEFADFWTGLLACVLASTYVNTFYLDERAFNSLILCKYVD
jgi:hypothetical protein